MKDFGLRGACVSVLPNRSAVKGNYNEPPIITSFPVIHKVDYVDIFANLLFEKKLQLCHNHIKSIFISFSLRAI